MNTNIEHRTSNFEQKRVKETDRMTLLSLFGFFGFFGSTFDVQCSMFDVRISS